MKTSYFFKVIMLILCNYFFMASMTHAQWGISGNPSTNPPTNFLGTTDAKDLVLKANNNAILSLKQSTEKVEITSPNNLGGTVLDVFSSNYPAIKLRSTGTNIATLNLGIATCNGCYSTLASVGDVVLAADGSTSEDFIITSRTSDDIIFGTGSFSGETERLRIISDGKIKIGSISTTGNYKLFTELGIHTPRVQLGRVISMDASDIQFLTTASTTETQRMQILNNGKVVIGNVSSPDGYLLYVGTGILTEKVKVALTSSTEWMDKVFYEDYSLRSIESIGKFINKHKHLPDMPSGLDLYNSGGVDVLEMFKLQQQKIEELTLYIIQMNERIKELEQQK